MVESYLSPEIHQSLQAELIQKMNSLELELPKLPVDATQEIDELSPEEFDSLIASW